MQYGICNLFLAPLRGKPCDTSEMVSQLLYGDHFQVLEQWKNWSKIRISFDNYEGWIDTKQYSELNKEDYVALDNADPHFSSELFQFSTDKNKNRIPVPLGARIDGIHYFEHVFAGNHQRSVGKEKSNLFSNALLYLNAPYVWGGKTPFGIDCSGLAQMVYKLHGVKLFRDASQQAEQGKIVELRESQSGDLAFFDNLEGKIVHVGIMMKDDLIIHAHGKVRIDHLDQRGIFNVKMKKYSHRLRFITRIK